MNYNNNETTSARLVLPLSATNSRSRSLAAILMGVLSLVLVAIVACFGGRQDRADDVGTELQDHLAGVEVMESTFASADGNDLASDGNDDVTRGGVLTTEIAECGIPDPAIDIARSRDGVLFPLVYEIHVGLMKYENDQSVDVKPELAESFRIKDDGLLYEFTLRKGLAFSDGSRLTADDVKWSWERALRKSTGASRANDVFGDIVGADVVATGDSQELSGVRVIDDLNLEIRLSAPRTEFLVLLADPVAYVISPKNEPEWGSAWVNDQDFPTSILHSTGKIPSELPIGAGPFSLIEFAHPESTAVGFSSGARCVLARNDNYWSNPANLDEVVLAVRQDIYYDLDSVFSRQVEQLGTGELDLIAVDAANIATAPDVLAHVRMASNPRVQFLTLNPARPPFDDIHFRRALAKSIDVNDKIRTVNGSPNQDRLVPSSLFLNESSVSVLDFDVDAAKDELQLSKYGATPDDMLIEVYLSSGSHGLFSFAIGDAWSHTLGIDVKELDFDFDNKIVFEELQMTEVVFAPGEPSPHSVLVQLVEAFGPDNDAPEVVQLREAIADAASELDHAERLRKYEDIERRVLNDVLAIPIATYDDHTDYLLQPWVKGFEYPQFGGSHFYNVWLDDAPQRSLE